eukprot:2278892-Amphidinium_carterae.1
MSSIAQKTFTYDRWDENKRKRQIRRWRRKILTIWILGVPYNIMCLVYCGMFLGNVGDGGNIDWSFSASVEVFLELVIYPFLMALPFALFLLCISDAALAPRPSGNSEDQATDGTSSSDLNIAEEGRRFVVPRAADVEVLQDSNWHFIMDLDAVEVQPRDHAESEDASSEDIFDTHFFESESVEGVVICDPDSEGPASQRPVEAFDVDEDSVYIGLGPQIPAELFEALSSPRAEVAQVDGSDVQQAGAHWLFKDV